MISIQIDRWWKSIQCCKRSRKAQKLILISLLHRFLQLVEAQMMKRYHRLLSQIKLQWHRRLVNILVRVYYQNLIQSLQKSERSRLVWWMLSRILETYQNNRHQNKVIVSKLCLLIRSKSQMWRQTTISKNLNQYGKRIYRLVRVNVTFETNN